LEGRAKTKSKTVFESQVSFFVCLKKKIRFYGLVIFLAVALAGFYFGFTSVLIFSYQFSKLSFVFSILVLALVKVLVNCRL
jgi:hypothetical protein